MRILVAPDACCRLLLTNRPLKVVDREFIYKIFARTPRDPPNQHFLFFYGGFRPREVSRIYWARRIPGHFLSQNLCRYFLDLGILGVRGNISYINSWSTALSGLLVIRSYSYNLMLLLESHTPLVVSCYSCKMIRGFPKASSRSIISTRILVTPDSCCRLLLTNRPLKVVDREFTEGNTEPSRPPKSGFSVLWSWY